MILPEQYSAEKAEERVHRPLTAEEEEELETEATQLASKSTRMRCNTRRDTVVAIRAIMHNVAAAACDARKRARRAKGEHHGESQAHD